MKGRSRRGKYNAVATTVDGVRFASKKEAHRYGELVLMQRAGIIKGLECHPEFQLIVKGVKVCKYVGDFRYTDVATGAVVIEDVKGVRTPVYRLKRKLMKALHNITIKEI